jgi:ribosomal protein S18 acetylase RimI-like enzyme
MLRYLEFWAAARGYEKLCLSVFSHNERALRLYRRMGYEEEGRRLGQFQVGGTYVDEVLMGKWISGRSATSPSAEHRS